MDPVPAPPAAGPTGEISPQTASDHPFPIQDALRVQTAALVAQQAAAMEETMRLRQRRISLDHQETQLAAHLEEKRRRLVELQIQAREAREQLQEEKAHHQTRLKDDCREIELARAEVADSQQQACQQRRRLRRLYHSLRRRWHRHWAMERQAMRRREEELGEGKKDLQEAKEALTQARLRFASEVEQRRQEMMAAQANFAQERTQWASSRHQQQAHLEMERQQLDQREAAVAEANRILADQTQQREKHRTTLQKEIAGLEKRVQNYRQRLGELEQETGKRSVALPPPIHGHVRPASFEQLSESKPGHPGEVLVRLGGELADQRLQLVQQWEFWSLLRNKWLSDLAADIEELEGLARGFQEQERLVRAREDNCRRREESLAYQWRLLEQRASQQRLQEVCWESERDRFLAQLNTRDELLDQRVALLAELRRRWRQRYVQEISRLHESVARLLALRQEWTGAQQEWLRRHAHLLEGQRDLAPRALALEQYRQKYLQTADHPALAERRLETLRRRWVKYFDRAEGQLQRERLACEAQCAAISQQCQRLHQTAENFGSCQGAAFSRLIAEDHQATLGLSEANALRTEVQTLQTQAEVYQREIQLLQAEVERLAGLLIDAGEPGDMPESRAA
jgi:hypothetical protein